jgi:hypothetical protein
MNILKNETSMMSESEIYDNQGQRRQQKGSGKARKTGEWRRAGLNPGGKKGGEKAIK